MQRENWNLHFFPLKQMVAAKYNRKIWEGFAFLNIDYLSSYTAPTILEIFF